MIRERHVTLSNSQCDCGCASAEVGWQMVACGTQRGCSLEFLRSLRGAPDLDFARRRVNRAAGARLARMCGVLLGIVLGARIRAPKFPPKSPARRTPKICPKICTAKITIRFDCKNIGAVFGASFGARLSRRGQGFLVGWRRVRPNERLLRAGGEISDIPLWHSGSSEARRRRAAANSGACAGAAIRGRRGRCESALPTLPAPARQPGLASKKFISEV